MIQKPIYRPSGKANEYAEFACNIYTGCNHGCTYCYARSFKSRIDPINGKAEFDNPKPRPLIVESVKRQLDKDKISGEMIHLCFMCDPYPAEIDTTPTRLVIQAIKEAGNNVQILTKGGYRAEQDFDLLDGNDYFGATITTVYDWMGKENLEPRAAHFLERLATLKAAKKRGIKTWVSLEPVIEPESVYTLIQEGSYIDLFKIGKMNYQHSDIDWAEFGAKCEALCKKHGRKYYLKLDLREAMLKGGKGGADNGV